MIVTFILQVKNKEKWLSAERNKSQKENVEKRKIERKEQR